MVVFPFSETGISLWILSVTRFFCSFLGVDSTPSTVVDTLLEFTSVGEIVVPDGFRGRGTAAVVKVGEELPPVVVVVVVLVVERSCCCTTVTGST